MAKKQESSENIAEIMNAADKIVPAPPLMTSHQAEWNSIFLAYYELPACEISKHALSQHTLTIFKNL